MNISVCILTWNNLQETEILIRSLVSELKELGSDYNLFLNICDNGSTDGTISFLEGLSEIPGELFFLGENKGISIAKNILIKESISQNSKYMFMFDNDVAVIKGSFSSMIKFMKSNPNVGCFGQHIDFHQNDINSDLIPKEFPPFENLNIEKNVKSGCGAVRAWTHYSVYNMSVFLDGVRFDTKGPFGGPGYGFDDDDLGMQISEEGYGIECFKDIYCYHKINSSVERLKQDGKLNYSERESYFKKKWGKKLCAS